MCYIYDVGWPPQKTWKQTPKDKSKASRLAYCCVCICDGIYVTAFSFGEIYVTAFSFGEIYVTVFLLLWNPQIGEWCTFTIYTDIDSTDALRINDIEINWHYSHNRCWPLIWQINQASICHRSFTTLHPTFQFTPGKKTGREKSGGGYWLSGSIHPPLSAPLCLMAFREPVPNGTLPFIEFF